MPENSFSLEAGSTDDHSNDNDEQVFVHILSCPQVGWAQSHLPKTGSQRRKYIRSA